ncbi:MAG: tRNA (adenosine(37)-N6)-dimethylallyltransferase MiaA [Panacagrimonas sp.]
MTPSRPVVLLMGPTASGKTGLSLALAQRLAARGETVEIISVDSAQVYRGMDIGTAKPDRLERAGVVHHLIDICEPTEAYSAARFVDDAKRLIGEIRAREHLPLLVGGTMLYHRALTQGISDLPSADPAVRARITAQAQAQGWPALHAQLAGLDAITAQRLHPNDGQRIQRALEVIETSGRTLSELHGRKAVTEDADVGFLKLALMPPQRAELHARIVLRLQQMFEHGFVAEVQQLRARGDLHLELPAMRAVGYRQIWLHLEARTPRAEAEAQALAATRQFAKRQITWLRSEHDLCWLNSESPDVVDVALRQIDEWKPKSPC